MATSKSKKAKSKISASESAAVILSSIDISNTLSQLATAITDFLASPPRDISKGVLDGLGTLQSELISLADTFASNAIADAIKDLEEPGKKIANFTTKIKTALQAIKDREEAFNTLATLINGLTNAVNSGNPQSILDVFNQ